MSGRSALVRKEKTKVKDTVSITHNATLPSLIGEFNHNQFQQELPPGYNNHPNVGINPTPLYTHVLPGSDDPGYARVRKMPMPVIEVSGIEKSPFRTMMDEKSKGVRKGLAKTFGGGKKKKNEKKKSLADVTTAVRPDSLGSDSNRYMAPPPPQTISACQQQFNEPTECPLPGPPQGELPPIPELPQLKRWAGSGRPAQIWNKLYKDPELWDTNGDTLIYFNIATVQSARPPPSFRVSSHVIEATESRFLNTLLRAGAIDDDGPYGISPSPPSIPGSRPMMPFYNGGPHNTPPMSQGSMGGYDGQISYELYFPTPSNQSRIDTLRHQITTRNIFAILYNVSLVGINLFQALHDLYERLATYLPDAPDVAIMIMEYITTKGIDDVRENPSTAASLLAWSEDSSVRWEYGWVQSFVHAVGMHSRIESCADYEFVKPRTKNLLSKASIETQIRVQACEERLAEFNFEHMWPMTSTKSPPARRSFERLRSFFIQHYQTAFRKWPPAASSGEEQWLTRHLAKKLQKDFAALYDYLVNREVTWDCSEERSGRKWNIVNSSSRTFYADTPDLPMTDILVLFDNLNQYPHIPHPYPLVPPVASNSPTKESIFKLNKKSQAKSSEDKMAEKKAALAYTESSNIYLLGSEFVSNELLDAFVRFEKVDHIGDVDPNTARRGRWVLIYGILQTLATVTVDTPNLSYTNDVSYHLNPSLEGTPPWLPQSQQNKNPAYHTGSHCWAVRETWVHESPVTTSVNEATGLMPISYSTRSSAPSVGGVTDSDTASSHRNPTYTTMTSRPRNMIGSGNASQQRADMGSNVMGYGGNASQQRAGMGSNDMGYGGNASQQRAGMGSNEMGYGGHGSQQRPGMGSNEMSYGGRGHGSQQRAGIGCNDMSYGGNGSQQRAGMGYNETSYTGYAPGIEKAGEWQVHEERGEIWNQNRQGGRNRARSATQRGAGNTRELTQEHLRERDFTNKDFGDDSFEDGTDRMGMAKHWLAARPDDGVNMI